MGEDGGEIGLVRLDEDTRVGCAGFEAEFEQSVSKLLVPDAARLMESVEGLI